MKFKAIFVLVTDDRTESILEVARQNGATGMIKSGEFSRGAAILRDSVPGPVDPRNIYQFHRFGSELGDDLLAVVRECDLSIGPVCALWRGLLAADELNRYLEACEKGEFSTTRGRVRTRGFSSLSGDRRSGQGVPAALSAHHERLVPFAPINRARRSAAGAAAKPLR